MFDADAGGRHEDSTADFTNVLLVLTVHLRKSDNALLRDSASYLLQKKYCGSTIITPQYNICLLAIRYERRTVTLFKPGIKMYLR